MLRTLAYGITIAALLALLYYAYDAGTRMRAWAFDYTELIRFGGDLKNAYRHGTNVIRSARETYDVPADHLPTWRQTFVAYLGFYDRVLQGWPEPGYHLDYPPMRLFVMTTWTRAIARPGERVAPDQLPACAPLLRLNIVVVALSSLGAALLVHHWVRRGWPASRGRAIVAALVAGLLVWFDFAILIDAHVWPQWDVWLLPFFLFAMLAGSHRRWMLAGLIFGVGIMFKGQLLVATPLLLLWPIFGGQWRGAGRLIVGLLLGVAVIEAMWVAVAPVALALSILLLGLIVAARGYLPNVLRGRHALLLGTAAVAVLVAAYVGGASYGWVEQGFLYGAERGSDRLAAPGAKNLGQLLGDTYGWVSTDDLVFDTVKLGTLMTGAFGLGVVACAVALARHDRRNDARALAAMVAPWLLFYALMPQQSGRYLIWAAASSAILVGIGVGPMLLHVVISVASGLTIVHVLILYSGNTAWWPELTRLVTALHPGLGVADADAGGGGGVAGDHAGRAGRVTRRDWP